MMRRLALLAVVVLSCTRERTSVIVGPPLTIARVEVDAGAAPHEPVTATFVDLTRASAPVTARVCELVVVSVVSGWAKALGEDLGVGDALVVGASGKATRFDLVGEGVALLAAVEPVGKSCPAEGHRVARAAKPLIFATGTMRAFLDGEGVSTDVYVGRLEGTASVPEHVHPGAWEILGAVEASGAFTVEGETKRLRPRQIVVVAPGTRHSWQPDQDSSLRAVQMYVPPGSEQRFRVLAQVRAN